MVQPPPWKYTSAGSACVLLAPAGRYARIGTPLGVTVDYDTMKDGTVTLRDRDTMEQERVRTDDLFDIVRRKVAPPVYRGPLVPAA